MPAAAEADAEVAALSGAALQAARAVDNRAKDSNLEVKGYACSAPILSVLEYLYSILPS
ncbi:hypothetical protein D3C81_2214410 [compost metagenome]